MNYYTIGIDIGGTHVRAVAYDLEKNKYSQIKKVRFEYKKDVIEEIQINLCGLISDICAMSEYTDMKLAGIGIALAALFVRDTGQITVWPNNQKWNGFQLKDYLEEYFKVPIVLEDDVNAAAKGEQCLGVARGYKNFAYVTISTGIGCGIVLNDNLFIGEHGWAGELGHIKVTHKDIRCTCGANGCLQAIASGPAILETYIKQCNSNTSITIKDVVDRGKRGDAVAKKVFEKAGNLIGENIANFIMLFDISFIVLGGGVIEAGEIITNPIRMGIKCALEHKRIVKVTESKLNGVNGVLGIIEIINQYVQNENVVN